MRPRYHALCFALIASAGIAHAEGPGIKLGDRLLLHVGLGAEFRYDSNVFYQASNTTGAFEFRLTPQLELTTRRARDGESEIDFQLRAGMTYNEFLTSDSSLSSHRSFGVDVATDLTLFPTRRFSLDIFDNYVRSTQPPYNELTFNLDRDTNELGVRFRIAPGGRRLSIELSYVFGIDFFEVDALKDFDLLYHRIDLRVSWKFFPKTALYLDANEVINTYANPGEFKQNANSYPLHISLGVIGLITPKLSVNAYVGYDNGFYVAGPSPNTAFGGLSLIWAPTSLSSGTIGYRHDFANSLLGLYYDVDAAFIGWAQLIWRFTANARLEYRNLRYQGIPADQAVVDANGKPVTTRTDNNLTLNLRIDFPFKQWLIASLGYDLSYNNSDSKVLISNLPGGVVPVNYTKHEVWLRLSVLY